MRYDRWRSATEWPLAAAAVVYLIAYSWAVIGELHGGAARAANIVMWAVWALFAVDYVVSLVLTPRRRRWFVRHLLDLAIVVLPALRPLRLLRLVRLATALHRATGAALRGRVTLYIVASAMMLTYIAAVAELDAERRAPHGNISNFGDSLWWAFTTVTTVGYGDYYPVTLTGRLIAVALMIGGIALIGSVTATLASWLIEQVRSPRALADDAASDAPAEP